MDSQSLTQLSQTSAETQMRLLEVVMQIIILTTLVLFAATLVIIVWLCLRESKHTRSGNPSVQMEEDENAGNQVRRSILAAIPGKERFRRTLKELYRVVT